MNMVIFITWLVLLETPVDAGPQDPMIYGSPDSLQPSSGMRIINGKDANMGQFPHQVSLQYSGRHFCGGSILTDRMVITACHCLKAVGLLKFQVVVGSTRLDNGTRHETVQSFCNFFYENSNAHYDYGFIFVSPSFRFNEFVKPIVLGTGDPSGLECTASGWGLTSQNPGVTQIPENLKFIEIDAIDDVLCASELYTKKHYSLDAASQLCTWTEGVNPCWGDSGGPLTCMKHGIQQLYGIRSFGWNETSTGKICSWALPSVWVDTASAYGRSYIRVICPECVPN